MSEENQEPSSTGKSEEIPPFTEPAVDSGGFKSVLQLFLVPLSIVLVAGGIFLAMNWLVGGEAQPEEILERVASGDSRRRGQAAFELSLRIRAQPELLQDPSFRARLLAVYEASEGQGEELRRYLTQVLSQAEIPEAVPALLQATRDRDPQTRLYATVALGNAKVAAAFDRLVELTRDDDPGIRSVAVASLGSLGDPRGIEPVEARLRDPALEVVWNAANALVHLGSAAGEGVLRRMLDPEYVASAPGITPEQTVQAMVTAVQGLARLEKREPRADRYELLRSTAESAPHPEVRGAALRAIDEDKPE